MSPSLPVVFVAPFGLRKKSTVWARTLPLARGLVTHGFAPTILIPPWDSPQDAGTSWSDDGVSVVNVRLDGGLPAILARLLRELWMRKPVIVHLIKPRAYAGLVQWLLWQRRRLGSTGPRLLLDIDDWEQAWAAINRYPPLLAQALAWQEEWGIRHADGITAASHWLASRAYDYTQSDNILYLPNGVDGLDDAVLPWREPPAPLTVLYFTRYVEVTPAWLAEMAEALLRADPLARLLVVGRPLMPEGDMAFRSGFTSRNAIDSSRVTWLGGVDPAVLPGLYAASQVAIFPALETPLQQAKCSVRLATTLLAGVPVVASAVGEQAHYGADGSARLVPPHAAPAEFAAAVVETLASPAARRAMVEQARNHLARAYRWDDLAARLARYYATIVESRA